MINACIITKNQSAELKKCLSALSKIDCNIVVCDTGSTDDSISVAKNFTDYVVSFNWCDDFSAAKNYCASQAPGDYILIVDTDEFLIEAPHKDFETALRINPHAIGQIKILNHFSTDGEIRTNTEWLPRIYNRKHFHFEGAIHEQIRPVNPGEHTISYFKTDLEFDHGGYNLSAELREKKANRNINLLLKEIARLNQDFSITEDTDLALVSKKAADELSYNYYQLGKGYYYKGDYHRAAEAFSTGLSFNVDENLVYVKDMVETYGYALLNSNNISEAANLLNIYDSFCDSADFCFVIGLILMNIAEFDAAILQFEKATTFSESKVSGVNDYLSYYNAGVILEVQGQIHEAKEYYKKCGSYEKATARLKEL